MPLRLLLSSLLLFAVAALLAGRSAAADAAAVPPPLRMLVLASAAMPLAEIRDDQVEAGLLKDLGERIARESEMPLKLVVMPRNRVAEAFEHDQADLYCDTLPEWLPARLQPLLQWSVPVNTNPQYVVSVAPRPAPQLWQQMRGATVVTLLGYEYPKPPELAQGFAEHLWERSDVVTEDAMLRRLLMGRGDFGIVGAQSLNWFLRNNPRAHINIGMTLVSEPTRCALTRRAGFPGERVLQAIKRLGDHGELQRLQRNYQPRP